jgi:sugar phosphate isomerase/epimerase
MRMFQSIVARSLAMLAVFVLYHSAAIAQKQLGIQLYTFRKEMAKDVPGTLEKVHKMGIKVLEGGGLYGMSAGDFKQLLKKYDLTMVSVGADFNELDSNVQRVVERARLFNAKYVMCAWIPHKGTEFGIGDIRKSIEVFNRAGKYLKTHGLTFCYHPHGYEFRPYENGTLFDELVSKTNPADVNFEMDVFWAKNGGADPVVLLKKYPTRFTLLHLKDRKNGTVNNNTGQADEETNVVLGEGDVNIKDIKKVAMQMKSVKYFFIEDESSHAMEQVPKSIAYWNSIK